ncbi:uncharacterized protein isoform X1 [Leptinotarsa decemlineata]|uniref:uncharacterized protein isoform X1 n=1 Tax=Leptinotarsa decemlineata TaxID=7539 RepID=UPI003D303E7B
MVDLQYNMPPGWDCKKDETTGRHYFINHYTRTTTWEDPRNRHKPFQTTSKQISGVQTEYIPLQHGSPDLRRNYVYPSQTSPLPAFQMPAHSPKIIPLQDMRPRMSPLTVRSPKVQDSSLSTTTDIDEAVLKIAAMFPTASENHIRLLLRKYNSREALVISALQVEKHPITTPGPFATPPPQRNIHQPPLMTPPLGFRVNSRGGSPIFRPGSGSNSTYTGSPRIGDSFHSSPRPHSSPKLKLRYMKSVFPQADETVILEILQNNDNSIQKTSDVLKEMGFNKKDAVKVAQQKLEAKREEKRIEEEIKELEQPIPEASIKTADEKQNIKISLQEKYKDVAEHLICIALESVNFDENRANQILQIMIQEDHQAASIKNTEVKDDADILDAPSTSCAPNLPISQSRQSIKSLLKTEKELEKVSYSRVIEENVESYRSQYLSNTKGPNPDCARGTNENLLLEDYVKWQGANPNLKKGSQGLAKGPNPCLLSNRSYRPCGPNKDLRKGPKFGLAKGSIFSQMKTVVVGQSRGK